MFAKRNPAQAYARIGIETGVAGATPHQLILMLYDGAILEIGKARFALKNQDYAEKGRAITHALEIIQDGLQLSLDVKAGGAIGKNLNDLYGYMCNRLLIANLKKEDEPLEEVGRLLGELKSAWEEIGKQPGGQQNAGSTSQPRSQART